MREHRKYAWQVAALLGVLGAVAAWRGRNWGADAMAASAALALIGAVMPQLLAPFWRFWMWFGRVLHRVVSPVMMAVLYIGIVTPVGVVRRTFGRSPLWRDPDAPSFWIPRVPPADDSPETRRQRMHHPY